MNPHDPSDLSFGSIELLEEEGKDEKQSNAHKEKEISTQGYEERPVPYCFDVHHLNIPLCLVMLFLNALNRVLAVLGMGKISKKGIMKEGY
jgi:hypothetical protein